MSGQSPSAAHIATLDLLRLVAAMSVVVFHYFFRGAAADGYLAEGYPEAAAYAIYGYLGVNLFFLISGFVIAWSAEGSRDWADFAVARFARLYPGFVVAMTLTFVVVAVAGAPEFQTSMAQWGANLFMFAPALGQPFMDGVYWSIVLEVIFYGWVALALFTGVFTRWKLEIVAVWLMIAAVNEFAVGSGAVRMLFVTEFAPLFAGGILFHHIFSRGASREVVALAATAFAISCATMGVTQAWMRDHYGIAVPFAGLLVANAAIHALLWLAIATRGMLAPSALTLALGGLTYPLYLLHQNIGYLAINRLAPDTGKWTAAVIVIIAMLVVSWAIWRYVEMPSRRVVRAVGDRVLEMLRTAPARLGRPG